MKIFLQRVFRASSVFTTRRLYNKPSCTWTGSNHASKMFSSASSSSVAVSATPETIAIAAAAKQQQANIMLLATMMSGGIVCLSSSETNKTTYNHCQVPCGIFDDPAIVDEMKQAAVTIRKGMVQGTALHATANTTPLSMNQMIRWINTKEEHCNKIINLVSDYCLCQRVKRPSFASEREYLEALKIHHTAMQAAMKAKQSMDTATCDALDKAIDDLSKMYTK